MADLAELGMRFTTDGAEQANRQLDAISQNAGKAEKATDRMSAANDRATGAIAKMVASIDRSLKQLVEMQRLHQQAAGATAAHGGAVEKLTNDLQQASTAGMYFGASMKTTQATMGGMAGAFAASGRAVGGLGQELQQLDAHMLAFRSHQDQLNKALAQQDAHVAAYRNSLGQVQKGFRLTAMEGLNLSRQMADIGVTAAMGMNPLMIALQQGPQLFDIFQAAAIRSGTTIRAAMVATGAAVWTALAPLLPIIAGIAATAGLMAGAFGLATRSMRKDVGDVGASMGLTKEQLERVKDAGVSTSLTIGDTFKATFQEIGANIAAAMKPATEWLKDTWGITLDSITEAARWGTQGVLAFFLGTYRAILATWRNFPAAFGDMVVQGANAAITAINGLINRAVDGLNYLDAKFAGGHMQIDHFAAKLLENPVAGAAATDAEATSAAYESAFKDVGEMMDNFAAGVRRRAIANRRAAILEAAGDAAKAPKAGKSDLERQIEETERYIQSLKDQAATLGMNAIAAKQYEIAQKAAEAPTADLRREVERYGAALVEKMQVEAAGLKPMQDQVALLQRELALVDESNRARAIELSLLAKRQQMTRDGVPEGSPAWNSGMDAAGQIAGLQEDIAEATFKANDALLYQLDLLTLLDDRARDAAGGMAEAFGGVGRALGDVLALTTGYARREEEIYVRRQDMLKQASTDYELIGRIVARSNEESRAAQVAYYGDVLSASKQFFGEQTGAYKALQAVEMAYRTVQFAMAAKSVAMGAWEAAQNIPRYLSQATAAATAGAAKMFASLGPLGFAAVAAMGVTLAAFGLRGLGGGGGSAPAALPETNTGTGTVLGSPGDASASLSKALDTAQKYQNRDLQYSSEMVSALRAIQDGIGAVTAEIGKQLGVGGSLNTDNLGLGQSAKSSFFGLFKSSSSTELLDQGLRLQAQTLGQILVNGIAGQIYNTTQTTKTKSGFFGIGGGTKISQSETFAGMDAELSRQMTALLGSLRNGVLTAAGQLGIEGAAAVLDSFQVNIGRISFKGMSSDQIAETLNNVFSAIGDQMATAVVPQLLRFQQAGEGMFETLARLVVEYQLVDSVMASMGRSFGLVGMGSIEARDRLVQLAGGLDEFKDSAAFFVSEFLTEAQQIAPIQAAVTAELQRLGIATNISRSQFADLVMGLDVSTEAGAQMYAALMALSPALDKTLDYTEELTGSVSNAAELDRQRRELEIALMEAQGRISDALAARRADELAAMDASLRPMQEAVWAAQDMAQASSELARTQTEAAEKIAALASQRRDMEIQLLEAQGRSTEALAAKRELELAALDATLRPLQLAIYAALDLATANERLSQAQAEASEAAQREADRLAAIASQRRDLEVRLMEETGNAAGALAARRADELAALDASLRPLQEAIYAAQDAAAAQAELARAQEEAAQAAEQAAEAARQLAQTRRTMEIDLLDALGQSVEALAARRQMELEQLDPSLRALQNQIYAAHDAAAANQALADAQQAAADKAAQLASQQQDLQLRLLEAQGNSTGALALRRQQELANTDESLRALLQSIYAAEDAAAQAELAQQAAEERRQAAEQRLENARAALSQAYEREAGALQQTIDKFAGFSESLRAFRADLEGANASSAMFARAEFERVSALARLGNEEALGSLQGVSQAYLDAARGSASTAADYQRAVAQVMSAVDAAIGTSDRQKTLAEQQLDALKAQVRGIVDLNESVLSVAAALRDFLAAGGRASVTQFAEGGVFTSPTMFTMGDRFGRMAEDGPEAIMPLVQTPGGLGVRSVSDDGEAAGEIRALRAEMAELRAAMIQTAVNTGQLKRQGDRAEQEGVYVRGEAPGDRVEVIAA